MPIYGVVVGLFDGRSATQMRLYEEDIDTVYWYLEKLVIARYTAPNIRNFDVQAISKYHRDYRFFSEYVERIKMRPVKVSAIAPAVRSGPGVYRVIRPYPDRPGQRG